MSETTPVMDVLGQAESGTAQVIAVLTDEQMVAAAGPSATQPTVFPWYDEQPDPEALVATATRSLVANGLVVPMDDGSVKVAPEVESLLAVRRGTPVLLLVERETSASKRWSYSYLYDSAVLEEQVSADGFHTFVLLPTTDLGAQLVGLLDPLETAGESRELGRFATMDDFEAGAAEIPILTEAVSVSTLTLIDGQADLARVCVVYDSPNGAAIMEGGPTPEAPDLPYLLNQASRDDLIVLVYRLIGDAALPAVSVGFADPSATSVVSDPIM